MIDLHDCIWYYSIYNIYNRYTINLKYILYNSQTICNILHSLLCHNILYSIYFIYLHDVDYMLHVSSSPAFSMDVLWKWKLLSHVWLFTFPSPVGSSKKQKSSRKTSISSLLTMPKPLTVWITRNCRKFWKRWEYQTTWPASWETCMQVRKQQLELDMEQQTGSK